jgi:hypothetical protein
MVPVIGAIVAASGASRLERRFANSQKALQLECLAASPRADFGLPERLSAAL